MNDWFTLEQIDEDTYAISEYRHWEQTHCYLVCGTDSAVLIDTGLGVVSMREVVDRLTALPVMAVTTHVHWDHIGGLKYFDNIAVYEAEREWLSVQFPIPLSVVKSNLMREPCRFPHGFSIDDYKVFQGAPQRILCDGDCLDLGERHLTVVHTPGHSPGHCCFYEPERKYLYSGDLIYQGCLDAFYPTTDPQQFFQSVKRVRKLDVERIMPGHHQLNVPMDLIDRIEKGFCELAASGKLEHGNGIFDFGDFQIHI